jgi:hypothetical protein
VSSLLISGVLQDLKSNVPHALKKQAVAFLYMGFQVITDCKCRAVSLDFGNF